MYHDYYMTLKYPKKSHRKPISIPPESEELAELMGIEFGDGGISTPWQIVITLNSLLDREFSQYVKSLVQGLFQTEVVIREREGHRLLVVCSSTNVLEYLVEKGAVRGNKIRQQFDMPPWIGRNLRFQRAFVRGLVDTDGCLYIHKHTVLGHHYSNLGFCFTSYSLPLIQPVGKIFIKNGIEPHITDKGQRIYLYNAKSVVKYLDVFGTSNPRIFRKYLEWRDRVAGPSPSPGKRLGA